MSTFASTIKTGNDLNINQLISELQSSLPARISSNSSTAGGNMSSTTFATLGTVSVAVQSNELLVFYSYGLFSAEAQQDDRIEIRQTINGVETATARMFDHITSAGGTILTLQCLSFGKDLSGTIAFTLQWRNVSGARKINWANWYSYVVQLKRRS